MSSLYHPTDWMDIPQFAQYVAGDRPMHEASADIQRMLVQKIATSSTFFKRNFLMAVDKDSNRVLQDPWLGQVILDICRRSQKRLGYAQQIVEIKPRQVGWTQDNIGEAIHTAMMPNRQALILVNDEDVAKSVMDRVGTFYNGLPSWMRPMKRLDNPKELVFDNPRAEQRADNPGLNSKLLCTVPSGIRGTKPNIFVWSEAAFCILWRQVAEAVFNAMGSSAAFCTVLDSTPNGEDEFYYPLVMQAIENNPEWVKKWEMKGAPTRQQIIDGMLGEPDHPEAGWVPAFMPWHWHEEYASQDDHPMGMFPSLTDEQKLYIKQTLGKKDQYGGDEEIELVERYGVTPGRLAWRRWMIDNKTAGSDSYERLLTFRQEFCSDYRSAFRRIGMSTFDIKGMDVLSRGIMPPAIQGKIRRNAKSGALYVDQTFHSDHENLRIWATPQSSEEYVIGVDGSNAWESKSADSWVAQVLRRSDHKQVAVYEMKCPPQVVRDNLEGLYYYYNRAYLGIEMEGSAISVARELYERGVTHQYMWKRMDTPPENVGSLNYLGWETSSKTRGVMQNALVEAIGMRSPDDPDKPMPSIMLRDPKTFAELTACTRDPYGKIANHSGGHDDHAVALMIALAIDKDVWDRPAPSKPKRDDREENPLMSEYFQSIKHSGQYRPNYSTL